MLIQTLKHTRPRVPGLAVSFLVVALIGCDSSSHVGGSSAAAVSSAVASPASAVSASSPASQETSAQHAPVHPVDVCATLPAASAAKLSGVAITTATARTGPELQEYGCAYSNEDDSEQVEVMVFEKDPTRTYDFLVSATKNPRIVSGLGDKAFFDNDGTMYVLAGSKLIQVNGLPTAEQCAALARPVLAAF